MTKHLIFYDGECGLCDHAVQFVLQRDKQAIFAFAPLQGKTAEEMLKGLPPKMKSADSLVLIENYQTSDRQFFIRGKGAFRICWLLGEGWTILGILSWLPAILYDWGYRFVAKNRQYLFAMDRCILPTPETKDRFLP